MVKSALNLLKSYLSDRFQTVQIGVGKAGSPVRVGVPQGSILGPFLFLVYINDLPFALQRESQIVLFADDTSLLFKVKRQKNDISYVNDTLESILYWFNVNNLALNAKKTKCVRFSLPNVKSVDLKLALNGESLDLVPTTVFLGITLDSSLQWGAHISVLAGKLSAATYAVRKIRELTDVATSRTVYFSYFHSIMTYGLLLWGRASDVDTIFKLQKRAVRAIYRLGPRESLRDFFKDIGILTLPCQYIFENIMYVRKNIGSFKVNSDRHGYDTRAKNKLVGPSFRLAKSNKSCLGNCVRFYNKIPDNVCELSNNRFKRYVKYCLLKKAYYSVNDYLQDKNAWRGSAQHDLSSHP